MVVYFRLNIAENLLTIESGELFDITDYIYIDSECKQAITESNPTFVEGKYFHSTMGGPVGWVELTTSTIPKPAAIKGTSNSNGWFNLKLELVNNSSKEIVLPTAGDKVGTVTISVDTK